MYRGARADYSLCGKLLKGVFFGFGESMVGHGQSRETGISSDVGTSDRRQTCEGREVRRVRMFAAAPSQPGLVRALDPSSGDSGVTALHIIARIA